MWIIDINGCKIHNPQPRKNEFVEWTGDCIDSIATGNGQLIWSIKGKKEKAVYTGELQNGRPEGKGKYVLPKGTIYEGVFKNGKLVYGKEMMFFGKNDTTIYVGQFENEMWNGQGSLYFNYKEWFIGEFENDNPKNGIYDSRLNGFKIECNDWTDYIPNSGKIIYDDGTVYEGGIKNFSPHGEGTVTYSDGEKESGKWRKGKLIT